MSEKHTTTSIVDEIKTAILAVGRAASHAQQWDGHKWWLTVALVGIEQALTGLYYAARNEESRVLGEHALKKVSKDRAEGHES